MINNGTATLLTLIALGAGVFAGIFYKQVEVEGLLVDKENAFEHWRQKVGSTTLWNGEMTSYNLRSFDAGETWYQVEYDKDWRMRIVGNAETLYPGLIKSVVAMDELTKHVDVNGPITLAGGIDGADASLLKSAGFSLEKN